MSFPAAYKLAESRGFNPENMQPFNPQDEAAAHAALAVAVPQELAEGWNFLARLAPVIKAHGAPWDQCLHCTVQGNEELATLAGIHALSYSAEKRHTILRHVKRLSQFDVPRQLVGEALGIWPFALFHDVVVLSPTPSADVNWAFQQHQMRLGWNAEDGYPEPEDAAVARAEVSSLLLTKHKHGLRFIEGRLEQGGEGQLLIPTPEVEHELWPDVLALTGTITGRAALEEYLGRPIATYNCCAPIFGPRDGKDGKMRPSYVTQLQMQSEHLVDC